MNDISYKQPLLLSLVCGLFVLVLVLLSMLGAGNTNPEVGQASASVALALAEPVISAEAYVVRFAGDPRPVIGRRVDKAVAPASLTKLMTAVVAAEKLAPADTAVLSAFDKRVEERRSPAAEGEAFGRDDLLRMALVMSANDAALALAARAGNPPGVISDASPLETFVGLMNAKAKILGMDATHFENPTGLDMPGHTASANDLARLAEYILARHPDLWAMTREQEATVETTEKKYTIASSNDLLKEFPALIGGKTGLTDNAKEALILLYPVAPDRTAIVVILRSDDRFGDGRKLLAWLEENF